MKIAVTGGNGDLGRQLIPFLHDLGHEIVSLDRGLPTTEWGVPLKARHMIADVCDFGQLVGCLRECEAVIHLAAIRSPNNNPDPVVYQTNTIASYNVLSAAATLGIERVCLASSINAIGGAFSRHPRYDYFPVDEQHATYAEDPYSLSKWVMEQQGDAFARRFEKMRIASLRFHWLVDDRKRAAELTEKISHMASRHLWAYTSMQSACRACLQSITADFTGHEVFYIVAPQTAIQAASLDMAKEYFPDTPIRGELSGNAGFFNCSKAARLLGWQHEG